MLYSHVTLLMLRVVDVVAKTTVQQSARMLVSEIPGDIQVCSLIVFCGLLIQGHFFSMSFMHFKCYTFSMHSLFCAKVYFICHSKKRRP